MTAPTSHEPDVSVVIPCRDAASTLGQQLWALTQQDYDGRFEVVVADNGSTDSSVDVARTWAAELPLRVVDAAERAGASYAYNTGAAAARSDTLLFCDADDEVAPGWIAAMAGALDRHDVVAGRLVPLDGAEPLPREVPQRDGLQTGPPPLHLPCAASCNLGVRRSAFERVGGFRDDLPVLGDTDLCWRLHQSGRPLAFEPDALVRYRLRPRGRATFRQAAGYGEGTVRLQVLHQPVGWRPARWATTMARSAASPAVTVARATPSRRGRAQLAWRLGWHYGRARGLWTHRRHLVA